MFDKHVETKNKFFIKLIFIKSSNTISRKNEYIVVLLLLFYFTRIQNTFIRW